MPQILIVIAPPHTGSGIDSVELSNRLASFATFASKSNIVAAESGARIALNVWLRDAAGALPLILELSDIASQFKIDCLTSIVEGPVTKLNS